MNDLYTLRVVCAGGYYEVVGQESELREVLLDWHEHGDDGPDGNSPKMLIRGHMDDAKRTPVTHTTRREAITGMYLIPLP